MSHSTPISLRRGSAVPISLNITADSDLQSPFISNVITDSDPQSHSVQTSLWTLICNLIQSLNDGLANSFVQAHHADNCSRYDRGTYLCKQGVSLKGKTLSKVTKIPCDLN